MYIPYRSLVVAGCVYRVSIADNRFRSRWSFFLHRSGFLYPAFSPTEDESVCLRRIAIVVKEVDTFLCTIPPSIINPRHRSWARQHRKRQRVRRVRRTTATDSPLCVPPSRHHRKATYSLWISIFDIRSRSIVTEPPQSIT